MTKEEAITAIKTWIGCMRKTDNDNEFAMEFIDGAETLMKEALKEPERGHGKWDNIPNTYMSVASKDGSYSGNATTCSVCHEVNPNAYKTNFCPNCGAKMDMEWISVKDRLPEVEYGEDFFSHRRFCHPLDAITRATKGGVIMIEDKPHTFWNMIVRFWRWIWRWITFAEEREMSWEEKREMCAKAKYNCHWNCNRCLWKWWDDE